MAYRDRRRVLHVPEDYRREVLSDLQWPDRRQQTRWEFEPLAPYDEYSEQAAYHRQPRPLPSRAPPQQEFDPGECMYTETPGTVQPGQRQDRVQQVKKMTRARRKLDFGHSDPDKVDESSILTGYIPEQYRYIPKFVTIARLLDQDLFWDLIRDFGEHRNWCDFEELPQYFQEQCDEIGVDSSGVDYLPGFAPKWVFAMLSISEIWYRCIVDHFFDNHEILPWENMRPDHVDQLKAMNYREIDY